MIDSSNQPDDYKTRENSYNQLNHLLTNSPTEELLDEIGANLPHYMCDSNQSCQRAALSLCETFFKQSDDINYAEFADILLHRCFEASPNQTMSLLDTCIKADYNGVSPLIYENLQNRSELEIQSILGVIISYLATLSQRSTDDAEDIIKYISPLTENSNDEIKNQAVSIINSAKIICGTASSRTINETVSPTKTSTKATKHNLSNETWPQQLESESWKERKEGYTQLFNSIDENYPISNIDHSFLLNAKQEKHIACQNIVLEIVEKMGQIYKEKMQRKLRDYTNIIIAMMSQKKNSRLINLQSAFDSLALNVTPNPYEPPFSEFLLKMMSNSNLRHREESLQFLSRIKNLSYTKSQAVLDQLNKLTSDPSLQIREMAASLLTNNNAPKVNAENNEPPKPSSPTQKEYTSEPNKRQFARNKRNHLQNQWSSWVNTETLELLSSGQWLSVTRGLDKLKEQYNDSDKSIRNALVVCFLAIFTGKTFTPKVMTNIYQNVFYYIKKDDSSKLSDEAVNATINFCLDKIIDKHNETTLFEILDECCLNSSDQYVFDFLYQHLSNVKNPAVVIKIISYLLYHLKKVNGLTVNPDSLFNNLKNLLTHGDQQVRKIANEICTDFLPSYVASTTPSTNVHSSPQTTEKPSTLASSLKKEVHAAPIENTDNVETSLISQRLILMVGKMSSILDCRRALEEIENILNGALTKNGPNSIDSKEFTDLFSKLRTWFKDSNTNIVFSVSKVMLLSFKLVKDVNSILVEFLNDLILLINFVQKGIKQNALQIFNELFNMMGYSFISNSFLPSFYRLNAGGRKTAVLFIRDILSRLEMNVQEFTPFIVNILADKNEEFRNAALPIIQKFISINGSIAELKKEVDHFPPAKKNMVLELISSIENELPIDENPPNDEEDESKRPQTAKNPVSPRPDEVKSTPRPMTGGKEEETIRHKNEPINETKIPKRSFSSTSKKSPQHDNQEKSSIPTLKEPKNRAENDSKIAIFKPKGNSKIRQPKQPQILDPLDAKYDDIEQQPQPLQQPQQEDETNNEPVKSDEFPAFVCSLNSVLTQKISDPSIYVYQWIADLNSNDLQIVDKASKTILKNLKSNPSLFTVHFDPLSVSLICKLHSFLIATPFPHKLCRVIINCIEMIAQNYPGLPKEYVQQIVYEYLGSHENCPELSDLISILIECQPMAVFVSLLSEISEFNDKSELALTMFEKNSMRVVQIGNYTDVCKSLFLLDRFYDLRNRKSLEESKFGLQVLSIFDKYVDLIVENYGEVVNSIENLRKFQANSTILPMIAPFYKSSSTTSSASLPTTQQMSHFPSHHRAESPSSKASPLQRLRKRNNPS